MNPFRRRRADDARTAALLRARLAEQARHAPSADALAERILADAARTEVPRTDVPRVAAGSAARWVAPAARPARRPRGRLLAVATTVAVVGGVGGLAAVVVTGPHGGVREATGPSTGPTTAARTSAPATSPDPATPSTARSATLDPAATASRTVSVPTLTGVRVLDVTFTGPGTGWGLASADCLNGPGRCTALLRTVDGGAVWQSRPNTPFQVPGVQGCAAPCVRHLRFATDDIGYAFGPDALFLTTDGARTWTRLPGGAAALETLDGDVIRVEQQDGCPPGCDWTVSTAAVGSRTFAARRLPGDAGPGDGVQLGRTGSDAYLLSTANPAGGAGRATSTLWTSRDDGRTWSNRGEPCVQRGGESDATLLTTAADGAVVVVCRLRQAGTSFLTVSRDGGASFAARPTVLGAAWVTAVGAATASAIVVSSDTAYRTADGGRTFRRLDANGGSSPGPSSFLGFSSATVGHAVSSDGRTISTTVDGGRTWRAVVFA